MPSSVELDVTSAGGRNILWLHSSHLDEGLAAYRSGQFSALGINASRGYTLDNIDFITKHDYIKGLHIVPGARQFDLKPIKALSLLSSLILNGPSLEIRLSELPSLEEFRGYWHGHLLGEHPSLRTLDLSDFHASEGDLRGIPDGMPSLKEIVLVQPRGLRSLDSISRLQGLLKVEVAHAKALLSLQDIDRLPALVFLKCDLCRNLEDVEKVLSGLNLRILHLNRCSPLTSLRFLDSLSNLEEFRFVETDVLDGNLRPLLRLRRVGFLPKKHFSHRPEEIERAIGQKDA